jgi:hypothetical protein
MLVGANIPGYCLPLRSQLDKSTVGPEWHARGRRASLGGPQGPQKDQPVSFVTLALAAGVTLLVAVVGSGPPTSRWFIAIISGLGTLLIVPGDRLARPFGTVCIGIALAGFVAYWGTTGEASVLSAAVALMGEVFGALLIGGGLGVLVARGALDLLPVRMANLVQLRYVRPAIAGLAVGAGGVVAIAWSLSWDSPEAAALALVVFAAGWTTGRAAASEEYRRSKGRDA